MSTKCRAAILVEPNQPLIIDEVEFADPAPDQVLVKLLPVVFVIRNFTRCAGLLVPLIARQRC